MSLKEELLKRLSDGVVEMEEDDVEEAAKEYLEAGYPAFDGIMEGLVDGMNRASQKNTLSRMCCCARTPCMWDWISCVLIFRKKAGKGRSKESSESWKEIPMILARIW